MVYQYAASAGKEGGLSSISDEKLPTNVSELMGLYNSSERTPAIYEAIRSAALADYQQKLNVFTKENANTTGQALYDTVAEALRTGLRFRERDHVKAFFAYRGSVKHKKVKVTPKLIKLEVLRFQLQQSQDNKAKRRLQRVLYKQKANNLFTARRQNG